MATIAIEFATTSRAPMRICDSDARISFALCAGAGCLFNEESADAVQRECGQEQRSLSTFPWP